LLLKWSKRKDAVWQGGTSMFCRLEHANITVVDLDGAIKFLTTAFPQFKARGGGETDQGDWKQRWVHVGTDEYYICFNEAKQGLPGRPAPGSTAPSYNHLGFEIKDAEEFRTRMLAAGYKEGFVPPPHAHRRRVYFHDPDGLEWEFVQYFSEDPSEKNDYSQ